MTSNLGPTDIFGKQLSGTERWVAQQEDACKMPELNTASDDGSQSKNRMEVMTTALSSPKIVTSSGRAVRLRLSKKLDCSSSQLLLAINYNKFVIITPRVPKNTKNIGFYRSLNKSRMIPSTASKK